MSQKDRLLKIRRNIIFNFVGANCPIVYFMHLVSVLHYQNEEFPSPQNKRLPLIKVHFKATEPLVFRLPEALELEKLLHHFIFFAFSLYVSKISRTFAASILCGSLQIDIIEKGEK